MQFSTPNLPPSLVSVSGSPGQEEGVLCRPSSPGQENWPLSLTVASQHVRGQDMGPVQLGPQGSGTMEAPLG